MNASRIQNLLRVGAVAAAMALGGVAAHAQPGPGGPGPGPGPHGGPDKMHGPGMFGGPMGHVLEVANATDAQRSQIEAIFKAARQDLAGQRENRMKLHQQMATLYTATNVDAAAIESVRQQLSALQETESKRMSQASIDAARVLSPEQRTKIAEVLKKREDRMAARRNG